MNTDTEDKELIQAYLSGDDRAFELLYGRYRQRVYWYLNQLLTGRPSEVDDIFQQTWMRAVDKMNQYHDNGCFGAWLMRIAHNLVVDRMRRHKKSDYFLSLDDENLPEFADEQSREPWFEMAQQENAATLKEALGQLPPDQREVFELRMRNLSFREIAERQKSPLNTVLGRMNYAKQKIKQILSTHF